MPSPDVDTMLALILERLDRIEKNQSGVDRSLAARPAADYIGAHPKTLAALRSQGAISGYRDGPRGHWRYRISDLDQYRTGLTQTQRPRGGETGRAVDWGA